MPGLPRKSPKEDNFLTEVFQPKIQLYIRHIFAGNYLANMYYREESLFGPAILFFFFFPVYKFHHPPNEWSVRWKWSDKSKLSHVWLFVTPWTIACQAPLSIEFSQAGILEWVAISFSRGSSWPRDRTPDSCIAGRFFTIWTTGKPWSIRGCSVGHF